MLVFTACSIHFNGYAANLQMANPIVRNIDLGGALCKYAVLKRFS